jgi:uncharacterized cupin superfamily protein
VEIKWHSLINMTTKAKEILNVGEKKKGSMQHAQDCGMLTVYPVVFSAQVVRSTVL